MDSKHRLRYAVQRGKAKMRGIDWQLTFEQWFGWWLESGHYHERGRLKDQYVMARFGDTGPYSLDNIMCIPNKENVYNHVKTHCRNGHPLVEQYGERGCPICRRIRDAKSKRNRGLTKRPMNAYKPRSTTP